jgi:RNA polymerase sigma factor (sigma-70 family)
MTPKEYNHCVELYADRVYRFMLKNTREAAEAEDMVQNAFEVLWRNHEKVEVDKARSYLFSVSHHQMIDSLRKNKRMSYTEEFAEGAAGPAAAANSPDLSPTLNNALEQLSEIQRSVVLLRDYEGYSYDEIAQITELTAAQVKVYIFRARKKLQQILVSIDRIV